MAKYRVRVVPITNFKVSEIENLRAQILSLGLSLPEEILLSRVYFIEADLSMDEVISFADKLLVDVLTEKAIVSCLDENLLKEGVCFIEIAYLPGVMDCQALTISRALREMFRIEPAQIFTARRYDFKGWNRKEAEKLLPHLYNPLIEYACLNEQLDLFNVEIPEYQFSLRTINILSLTEQELRNLSEKLLLSLNSREMLAIQSYYKSIGRDPTDIELETIAQTWSEHCQHKTFKAPILYQEINENGEVVKEERITSLFKDFISRVTEELNFDWCLSVFVDNAGVIDFDEKMAVCFKVETHNHPSALEPFGGANTGVGGVIRDVLGCGLGAKPIANTDVFCFAPPDLTDVPDAVIPPVQIMKGVVSGVRDYGNKMGIPTVNGAVFFDEEFVCNPLVFCGTLGVMPKSAIEKKVEPGDKIVLIGGKTGRDGIHGATFSSIELDSDSHQECSSAVQIGNPIEEKKMADVLLRIRDKGWYRSITDCGAGGLSSAIGEMARDVGAIVYLEKVPLKYSGLSYTEIWISESQERMVLAVKPEHLSDLLDAFHSEDVEATCIGDFTGDKSLKVYYCGSLVMDMNLDFLFGSVPLDEKKGIWIWKPKQEEEMPKVEDPRKVFRRVLSSYNIASKEWVIRQYDHEVQGKTVLKPLAGPFQLAPMDAAVLRMYLHGKKGVAISCGINPHYGKIDPYHMAGLCIDEAIRQIISVGGSLSRIALLDNFCWGNPDKPDRLGSLVRAVRGCYDFAKKFEVPFISGKDSLYNEYKSKGEYLSIPGTLLISALGLIEDISRVVSSDLKRTDSLIYCLGVTRPELGGSAFLKLFNLLGGRVPVVEVECAKQIFAALEQAISEGLVLACHDVSDGGIGVCVAEMCIGSKVGVEVFLNNVPFEGNERTNETILYSETPSRFIVEVEPRHRGRFEKIFEGLPIELIGRTIAGSKMEIYGLEGEDYIIEDLRFVERVWRSRFRW